MTDKLIGTHKHQRKQRQDMDDFIKKVYKAHKATDKSKLRFGPVKGHKYGGKI